MNETQKPNRTYFQFGILYGAICALLAVIIFALGINIIEQAYIGTINSALVYFVLPLIFVYLGCVSFKNNNFGYISYTECLKVGVGVVFLGALIFGIYNTLFYYIFPENIETIMSQYKQVMLKQNPQLTASQLEAMTSTIRKFSTPVISFPIIVAFLSFLGFLYSLFIGLIVKKDNPAGI